MEFMTKFETVLLLSPELSITARNDIIDNFNKIISDNSGSTINAEDWGLRDLSYKINNFSKAFYNFFQIEIEGDRIENIKKILNQDERFIRYIFLKVENHQELPTKLNYEKK